MTTAAPRRQILPDVPRLRFGPPSDVYSVALQIVLSYIGEAAEYPEILYTSGRGFINCWTTKSSSGIALPMNRIPTPKSTCASTSRAL